MGLFTSSPLFYAYKMGSTFALACVAAYMVAAFSDATWAHWAARTAGWPWKARTRFAFAAR